MVNSFGQFTGDVRVSGHISQAGGEVSECWLSGLGVFSCFLFFVKEGEDALWLQSSFLETWFLTFLHCLPFQQTKKNPVEPGHGNDKKIH